jgi:hypothetical protein
MADENTAVPDFTLNRTSTLFSGRRLGGGLIYFPSDFYGDLTPSGQNLKDVDIFATHINLVYYYSNLSHYTSRRRLRGEVCSYSFLTFALYGVSGQRHAPSALYPRGKDLRYPLDRRQGGSRAGLDTEVRGKISYLCQGSNLDRPVAQSVVRQYTY